MIHVFVIILNWNGRKDTLECLFSLKRMKLLRDLEVTYVVVDNGSSDGSVKSIKTKFKDVIVLQNRENLGFVGGNNVGLRYALEKNADWVLILNNDTQVDSRLIDRLLGEALEGKEIGIVVPKIYFAPGFEFHKHRYKSTEIGRVFWYAGGKIDWSNVFGVNRGVDEVDSEQYEKSEEVEFASGACMLLKRTMLEKVGLFDERYFMYFEDVDLSVRAKRRGWKIMYEPKAIVWHKVARSSAIGGNLNDYFITRNRLLFGMCWAPTRAKFALLRESIRTLTGGREWQKRGIKDFLFGRFGKGSWK